MTVKKLLASLWLLACALTMLVGAMVDFPQWIDRYSGSIPKIMTSPNFWWCIGTGIVTVIGLGLIWLPWGKRRTEDPEYPPDMPGPERYLRDYRERLAELVRDLLKEGREDDMQRIVSEQTEIAIPLLLQRHFGNKSRSDFESVMEEVKHKAGGNVTMLFNMAINYIDGELMARHQKRQATVGK